MPIPYDGIKFAFKETIDETRALGKIADGFLDPNTKHSWDAWAQDLELLRTTRHGQPINWEIPLAQPLKTRTSDGCYEPDQRRGRLSVFGRISSKWEIQTRGNMNKHRYFWLVGMACTRLTIATDNHDLFEWSFEAGCADSPGCHFHMTPKLPPNLSVPRLPSILLTPTDAVDFLLGELFQNDWSQALGKDDHYVNLWRKRQGQRLQRLLTWKHEAAGDGWTGLKEWKPKPPTNILAGN